MNNMGTHKGLRQRDINEVLPPDGGTFNPFKHVPYPFGHIRWIQRLDQEPPTW